MRTTRHWYALAAFVVAAGAATPAIAQRALLQAARDDGRARIVLLEAPDSALAEQARLVLGDDPSIDWVEPLQTRTLTLEHLAPSPPRTSATLDSLPNDPMLRSGDQYGLWNIGPTGTYGGIARAYLLPHLSVTASVSGFSLWDSLATKLDATGNYVDMDFYATYNINNYIGVQGGYRKMSLTVTLKKDYGDMEYAGIWFGGVVRY